MQLFKSQAYVPMKSEGVQEGRQPFHQQQDHNSQAGPEPKHYKQDHSTLPSVLGKTHA